MDVTEHEVEVGDVVLHVATTGSGPTVLLLHGFPHTWRVWSLVMPALARGHRVVAPDLRGLGGSSRAGTGYDAASLADDVGGLMDALGEESADVVAIDAGVPPAFLLALTRPERVRRLVLVEALLGLLPGAEEVLAGGPPWWFGFHAVPGLAEEVLVGHEAAYVDWFLRAGTHDGRGAPPDVRDAFVAAYTGRESLRCAFEHYRAMPANAGLVAEAVRSARLAVPTLAVGAQSVGSALHRQLEGVADDLSGRVLEDCGHIVPLDRPRAFLDVVQPFLAGA